MYSTAHEPSEFEHSVEKIPFLYDDRNSVLNLLIRILQPPQLDLFALWKDR